MLATAGAAFGAGVISAMSRLTDWEARLNAYIERVAGDDYAYGRHDCGLFCAGAVQAMTGDDPAEVFRGAYDDVVSAAQALRDKGAGTLVATVASLFDEKPPAFAQRGDIVWNGAAIGICFGPVALFVSDGGLTRVARSEWERAFSV